MQKHKFNIFPDMQQEDYSRLKSDIQQYGYDNTQPIILYRNEILDGWNRQKVCDELNIKPNYKDFDGNDFDAINFVMRTNKRRNLTSSQWACIAVESDEIIEVLKEQTEKERREKISKRENVSNQYTKQETCQLIDTSPKNKERVTQKLAKTFNTNRSYVSEAKKLKERKTDFFEQVKSGEKTLTKAVKEAKREDTITALKEKSKDFKSNEIQIYNADFREYAKNIKENSIDLILTDPPYPKEYLSLWQDLFIVAEKVLKPSAFLIAYSGQMYINEIFKMKNDLIYYWTMNIVFSKKPLIFGRNIINEWKPILIFQKKPYKTISDTISDTISFNYSERDMHDKNWGQTVAPFKFLLEKFSNINDIIFEPFAGTGTTLIACKETQRNCIGTEVERQYIDLIKGRLS
jgi:hypothetical protein